MKEERKYNEKKILFLFIVFLLFLFTGLAIAHIQLESTVFFVRRLQALHYSVVTPCMNFSSESTTGSQNLYCLLARCIQEKMCLFAMFTFLLLFDGFDLMDSSLWANHHDYSHSLVFLESLTHSMIWCEADAHSHFLFLSQFAKISSCLFDNGCALGFFECGNGSWEEEWNFLLYYSPSQLCPIYCYFYYNLVIQYKIDG